MLATLKTPAVVLHWSAAALAAYICLALQALPNKLALIVNHENITQNWYVGNDRSMLVCNCLFRLGGAGALLSNRSATPATPAQSS